ncbi:hypothetical protein CCHR01_11947 [Colletotrichum chrysophilum]|uniref:Uncharacterized protein n=1 Tax=Colletotrichum chrysophilum TaxID=1836956 RepID=A0AAD9AC90_9PEZI|nr:hypothetical protein CCHR01_11947 [Colletotrichum chrysophilum]
MLLVKQTFRLEHSYVASIGAIITIAALAIDPFSQAMIEYRPCPQILGHEVAETPRTNNYSAGVDRLVVDVAADPSMLGAIYKGLVDPEETESLLDVKCTTGNCTFGEMGHDEYFSSLGFCHSCDDITRQVEHNETDHTYTLRSNVSSPKNLFGEYYGRQPDPSVRSSFGYGALLSASVRADYPTLVFETLMLSCMNSPTCAADMKGQPLAFRCTLTPCVERYRAEVENGRYREMKSKTPGQELNGCPIYMDLFREQPAFAAVTDSSLVNGVEQPCNPSTKWFPNSVEFSREHNVLYVPGYSLHKPKDFNETQWKFYPQKCVWAVKQDSWEGIRIMLGDLLGGDLMSNAFEYPASSTTGPPWLKRMYSDG